MNKVWKIGSRWSGNGSWSSRSISIVIHCNLIDYYFIYKITQKKCGFYSKITQKKCIFAAGNTHINGKKHL